MERISKPALTPKGRCHAVTEGLFTVKAFRPLPSARKAPFRGPTKHSPPQARREQRGLIMSLNPKNATPHCHFFDEKHEHLFALNTKHRLKYDRYMPILPLYI